MRRSPDRALKRPSLPDSFASPESKRRYVRDLFATIADRYDLITVLLSFGRDRTWKERLLELSQATAGTRALDLACGTGDITLALASRGARVCGLDVTHRMVQLAQQKAAADRSRASFLTGDMMALPFPDAAFDLVTVGYGIRNVPRIEPAIDEIRRVLTPGGLFLSLDFNTPANTVVRAVYLGYLTIVGSLLGWTLHGNPDTYRYIPESIKRYPGAGRVAAMLTHAGFDDSRVVPLLGGLMALNIARVGYDSRHGSL